MKNILVRCILFWILFELLIFAAGAGTSFFATAYVRWAQAIACILVTISLIYAFLYFEKKSFADLGLIPDGKTIIRFLAGVMMGIVMMILIVAVLVHFSELTITQNLNRVSTPQLIGLYLLFIPLAIGEELAFRSYSLIRLQDRYGVWTAQFISAIAFALYHVIYGWSWSVSFMGPFVWAFFFAVLALRSGGIAMPSGFHAALNVMQAMMGIKGNGALFVLKLKEDHSRSAQQHLDWLGIWIHIILWLLFLLATWHTKKKMAQ
jgi:uncharacterized protein